MPAQARRHVTLVSWLQKASPRNATALEPRFNHGGDLRRLAKLMPESDLTAPATLSLQSSAQCKLSTSIEMTT